MSHRSATTLWVATLALLLVCASTAPARAEEAAALLQRAEELFNIARFRRSLALLKQAAQRTAEPKLLGRIQLYRGLNFAVLGEGAEADRAFSLALESDPTLQLEPGRFNAKIVERFNRARAKLLSAPVGQESHDLASQPSSTLRKEPSGRPRARPTAPSPRPAPQARKVQLVDRETYDLFAQPSSHPRRDTPAQPRAQHAAPGRGRRAAGWTLFAFGSASLAASGVLGALVYRRINDYNAIVKQATYGELNAIADEGHRFEMGHLITLGAGAALAATGIGLLIWDLVENRRMSPRAATRIAPFASSAQAGASWSQQF